MKSTKKLLEMLRDEAVEKLPMKDMGLCFLICNSTDKRKVSSKERDRLYMYILRNAPKDATLHAQRLAEKMVEERLVEFGNMIRDEPNGDIPALADYFMRTINLKTRER